MPATVEYKIALLDGRCSEAMLREDPGGILYGSLKAAMAAHAEEIRSLFPDIPDGADGAFIYVPEGVKAEGVFVIENHFTARECSGECADECGAGSGPAAESVVLLMNGASAAVQYEVRCGASNTVTNTATNSTTKSASNFATNTAAKCAANTVTNSASTTASSAQIRKPADRRRIRLGEGASLRLEELVFAGSGKLSIESRSQLGAGAVMDTVTVEKGGSGASLRYTTDLAGEGARASQAGLFMLEGEETTDFDVAVNHLVPDCRSDVLVKGVAGGNSRGSFSGLVYVAQHAQHTEAYQQSRNLLLADTARILTSPRLEIYADDVKCSHGATVGQMNDDAIYYMRQRGLSESQARGLQMAGFVNDIVSRIGNEEKRQIIFNELKMNFELKS